MRHQYTPIFRDLLTSSLWASATPSQRCVWITLLLLADPEGYVPASVPGLALAANVSVDEARAAVAMLEAPDPDSRTLGHEGRRIEKVDHGWRIINFVEWRARAVAEAEKARKRTWAKAHRAKPANDNAEDGRLDRVVHPEAFPDVDAQPLHVAECDESSETVDAPKPIPKPKPKPSSPKGEGSPLPPGVFDAPVLPLTVHSLPDDWEPSDELRAEAVSIGLTSAELDQRIAHLRTTRIGGQGGIRADKINEWVRNQLGRWKTWAETDRAKAQRAAQAPPGRAFGGGYGPGPQLEANESHARMARLCGIDLAAVVRELNEQRVAEKLGVVGARSELEKRLMKLAIANGYTPPKRAVV